MMFGADKFKELFEKYKNRPLLLYGDPDTDGLISLLFMCQFADMMGLKYSYYVNEYRYHGFDLPIEKLKGYLIIASDFTITEPEVKAIVDNNIVLLSTDHHDVQEKFIDYKSSVYETEGVVINNQYPFEPDDNKYQSGAGVFYELICEIYPEFKSKEREALVGVTLLSDMRPIENAKARSYLKTTYSSNYETGYIYYLISNCLNNDFSFGVPKFDRNFIDYYLNPVINALLRANKTQEAVNFILGSGLTRFDAKGLQQRLIADMSARVEPMELVNIDVLAIKTSQFLDYSVNIASYIGLFCNDYKNKHNNKSVIGFVIDNGRVVRASFRGKYDDIHYRAGFQHIGVDAQGHPGAFGIQNLQISDELWVEIDDLVGDLESNHTSTIKILQSNNLAFTLTRDGARLATENCYVRDMYRTYIRYTGHNAKIVKQTYKQVEFDSADYASGQKPDVIIKNTSYKYVRDKNNNPITKYIEYLVDGRKVKSFGATIEDGLILPILEKGYLQLYVRSQIV